MALWDSLTQPPSPEDVSAVTKGSLLGPLTPTEMAKTTRTPESVIRVIRGITERGGRFQINPNGKFQVFGVRPTSSEDAFFRKNRDAVFNAIRTKPGLYQRAVAGPTKALTAGIGKVEPKSLQNWVTPETLAKTVIPQTPTAAGVDVGLLLAGGAPSLAARLAAAGVGGAAGAGLGGESVPMGALQGVTAQGTGEVGGKVLAGIGRKLGGQQFIEKTTADVGEAISQALPGIGGVPETAADLEKLYTHGDALEPLRAEMARVSEEAGAMAPGAQFDVPTNVGTKGGGLVKAPATLKQAEERIRWLDQEGRKLETGDPRWTRTGQQMRTAAYQGRQAVAKQLNKVSSGLGDEWLQSRKKFTAGRILQRIFREEGAFDTKTGTIDQGKLTKLISKDYWDDLVRNLGRKNTDKILAAVRRGGASGVKEDISGYPARIGARLGGMPFIRPFVPPEFVGETPWYMKPGPYRLPVGALAGGAMNQGEQ